MKKPLLVFLYGLSLAVLIWIGWTVSLAVQKPSVGAVWAYQSGVVFSIDAGHPSASAFQIGDRIIRGADQSPSDLYRLGGKANGEYVQIVLDRNGIIQSIDVLVAPSSFTKVLSRLPALIAALGFWLAGSYVLAFSRFGKQSVVFFFLCLTGVLSLTCGAISSYGPAWTRVAFHCGLLWLGVFVVQLHLVFPSALGQPYQRITGFSLMAGTSFLCAMHVIENLWHLGLLPIITIWHMSVLMFAIEIGLTIWLVIRSYWKAFTSYKRIQTGIITLSCVLGAIPIIALILIPQVLLGHPFVSFNVAFLALLFIPFGYGYAIYRYKLIGVKETANRGLAFLLVVFTIAGLYSLWYSASAKFISPIISQTPIWGLTTTVFLAGLTVKAYRFLVRFVNTVLYGGWYDYRSVIEQARQSLTSTDLDRKSIGATLCEVVGQSMRLENVSLVLPDGVVLTYTEKQPITQAVMEAEDCKTFLANAREIVGDKDEFLSWQAALNNLVPPILLDQGHRPPNIVLLRGRNNLPLGVLLMGQKRDGDTLSHADFEILKVVIHQAQVTLENARLLEDVQAHAEVISRLHRQVLRAREEERKRLARDLHDLIIQSLVGVNYQLAEIRTQLAQGQTEQLVKAQTQIKCLIGELRQICADLRPPTLDVLEFTEAIQTKVAEIEENAGFRARVLIEGNEDQDINDDVKLCIYRLIQESLINANKHAMADHVEVWVQITSEQVMVMVSDNGKGFEVPARLEHLVPDQHYGLIGIKEMVEAINGSLSITSKPGQGCVLAAQMPVS